MCSVDHFLATRPIVHRLFDLPAVTPTSVHADIMHIKYIGANAMLAGSVLFVMTYMLLGGTIEENTKLPW